MYFKSIYLFCLLFLSGYGIQAQPVYLQPEGCGTVMTSKEMKRVQEFVQSQGLGKSLTGVDSIPLSIHIVGRDNGTGYYRLDKLLRALCNLNNRFAPADIYFYVKWPIHYINNTSFFDHDYVAGRQMMILNNVPSTINCYFVQNPSGNCGYYSPLHDAVALANYCSEVNGTTWVHELGHFLGLPHTFHGWEHGNIPANPEKVTRGAGANCSFTGDLFCDTEADYISSRWNCPYSGTKLDHTGTPYRPDSSLYMSYSMDNCQSRFSNQQIGSMKFNIANHRPLLVSTYSPTGNAVLSAPKVLYPQDSMYANNKRIRWTQIPGADYYYVRVELQIAGVMRQEAFITDTSLLVDFPLVAPGKYQVKVYPISSVNTCSDTFSVQKFVYSLSTPPPLGVGSMNAEAGQVEIYPNPAKDMFFLKIQNFRTGKYRVRLTSIDGQLIEQKEFFHSGMGTEIRWSTADIADGLYFLKTTGSHYHDVQKILIHH